MSEKEEKSKKTATSRQRTKAKGKKQQSGSAASKKNSESSTSAKDEAVHLGTAPTPMVLSRHRDSMHERRGRGYSLTELRSVGIDPGWGRRVGLPLDLRRRSGLEPNVESLRAWYGKGPTRKAEPEGEQGGATENPEGSPKDTGKKKETKKKKASKAGGRKEGKKAGTRKTRAAKETKEEGDEEG